MPDSIPEGSVVITPSEQYQRTAEQFGTITEKLGEVQRTLHPMATQVAEHDAYIITLRQTGLPEAMTKMGARLDRLERFMWLALGISLASGASDLIKFIG